MRVVSKGPYRDHCCFWREWVELDGIRCAEFGLSHVAAVFSEVCLHSALPPLSVVCAQRLLLAFVLIQRAHASRSAKMVSTFSRAYKSGAKRSHTGNKVISYFKHQSNLF